MSCKDCDAYCINAGEEDAVSCEGYIPKLQTNADRTREEAKEPEDYPEVDAEELEEFQSFCDFIERRTTA